jgi:hypothetical protein
MKTIYRVEVTEQYLEEARRLGISQNPVMKFIFPSRWTMWPRAIIISGFMIYLYVIQQLSFPFDAFLGAMIVVSFVGPFLNRRSLARTRQRNPVKGSVLNYSMDEEGFDLVTPVSNAHLQWTAFSRAINYPQGVLVKMRTNAYIWLPDKSLAEGSVSGGFPSTGCHCLKGFEAPLLQG